MRIHALVFNICRMILEANARVYGTAASREQCRDLAGYFHGDKRGMSHRAVKALHLMGDFMLGLMLVALYVLAVVAPR